MSTRGAGRPIGKFLRWREAAELVHMGVRTLQRYAAMGAFKVYRPSIRLTLVDVESPLAWAMGGGRGCV